MLLLLVFGKIKMLSVEFYASFLVVAVKSFLKVEEVDSEEKSISYFVVTLQQQNLNFFSMFIKLHQEVFIHQVREVLQ